MAKTDLGPLHLLVLLFAVSGGTKGVSVKASLTKLRPLCDPRIDRTAADTLVASAFDALRDSGELDTLKAKSGTRYLISSYGKERVTERVGLLPPKATWGALRDKALLPTILQIPLKAKASFEMMRGLLIAQALEASESVRQAKTEADLLNRLAAIILGAPRPEIPMLKDAIVRRWVMESPPTEIGHGDERFDYETFADRVRAAATASKDGRVGAKVFINHVWLQMERSGAARALDLERFRDALLETNRRRLISLSRADLSQTLSPDDVRASELSWHGDTFHFVEIDR